jgi:hypothetical protein
MQTSWNYLDLPEFEFRQRMVVEKFNQHKCILEVGSFDRKLRTYFTEQYKGKIISCDPLLPKTIEFENGDIQFSGTLVQCSSFLNDKKITNYSFIFLYSFGTVKTGRPSGILKSI